MLCIKTCVFTKSQILSCVLESIYLDTDVSVLSKEVPAVFKYTN